MISDKLSQVQDPNNVCGYKYKEGTFLLFNDLGSISFNHNCRDVLLTRMNEETRVLGFFSSSPPIDINSINHFFEEFIEQKLGIKESVIFHLSNIPDLIVVEIGQFWRENIVRRSLFSLFLRCAALYKLNTLDESIQNYPTARTAKNAINYFLEGNIIPLFDKWSPYKNGFVTEFADDTPKDLEKKLTWIKLEKKSGEHFAQKEA